jgi:hypothetical protein
MFVKLFGITVEDLSREETAELEGEFGFADCCGTDNEYYEWVLHWYVGGIEVIGDR